MPSLPNKDALYRLIKTSLVTGTDPFQPRVFGQRQASLKVNETATPPVTIPGVLPDVVDDLVDGFAEGLANALAATQIVLTSTGADPQGGVVTSTSIPTTTVINILA